MLSNAAFVISPSKILLIISLSAEPCFSDDDDDDGDDDDDDGGGDDDDDAAAADGLCNNVKVHIQANRSMRHDEHGSSIDRFFSFDISFH